MTENWTHFLFHIHDTFPQQNFKKDAPKFNHSPLFSTLDYQTFKYNRVDNVFHQESSVTLSMRFKFTI